MTVQQREGNRDEMVCFNTRGRKGVEEEASFQLSGWEMRVEKNYNRDAQCVRGI